MGNKLFFYVAGSVNTKQNTYTDSTGTVANTNPIVLNSLGIPTNEIWFTAGLSYKVVYAPSTDTDPPTSPIWTIDNLRGINDITGFPDQWIASGFTPTYVSATQFTLVGDQTSIFQVNRRIKTTNSGGTVYSTISASTFGAITTITVVNDGAGVLDSGLSAVSYGLISYLNSAETAASLQFLQAGTGATARTTQAKLRDFWNVKDFGALGDSTTNDTAAIVLAMAAVSAAGGGILYFPAGTYMVSALTRLSKVSFWGAGHYSTIIKCNTVGTNFITFTNISRISDRDIQFTADAKRDVTWYFSASLANSCGSMLFEHVFLDGANVNTISFAAAGGGSDDDISHLTFVHCYVTGTTSSAIVKNAAANGLDIVFIGGFIEGASPSNIDLLTGQITCFETFFNGATVADIRTYGGQIKIYGGRTESTGDFFNGVGSDVSGLTQAPHILEGVQGSNSGTYFARNDSTRVLSVDGNVSTSLIRCGAAGVIAKGVHVYTNAAFADVIDAGGKIYAKGTTTGSWTPTFVGLTLGAPSTVTLTGRYTKLADDMVHAFIRIVTTGGTTTASVAGTTYCSNLPFTASAVVGGFGAASNYTTGVGIGVCNVPANGTQCWTPSWAGTTNVIEIGFTYKV